MALNLIQAAREQKIGVLLNVGSSCMYPRDFERPLRPSDLLTGELEPTNEGYALAKLLSWKLCAYAMREEPGLQYKTLVPCNLYGRYDHFDPVRSHLVPATIQKLAQAVDRGVDSVEIWGDGSARREFMYAGDLADFIWSWLPRIDDLPDLINVGLGTDHTVLEYYRAAAAVVGFSGRFIFDRSRPVGMNRKLLDVTEQTALGWSPQTTLEDGLRRTYDFYRAGVGS
jgi:GDP-L-fucose synthase